MKRRRRRESPPLLKDLRSIQLTLDLPQTRIKPGARVLYLVNGKTGRIKHWCFDHVVGFPGGQLKSIDRHLLVEIQ